MCGIAGVVGPDTAVAEAQVRTMLARLVHRGPDAEGIWRAPGAVLGARRLAIIDLVRGDQPMTNEDGTVVAVQNGEIYNFRELRAALERRGHRFKTDNDTEILPHAYEEFGDAFVEQLRGMFALAVWDDTRRRVLLARDRMGKKPLVYARLGGAFAFASEIQALLALPIGRRVDDVAIGQYLALGYVSAPRTGLLDIRRVRPGHSLVFTDGEIGAQRPYWTLAFEPKLSLSEEEALERLRHELAEAVRVRLISDVPLGAFLSGGLDSSTVVAFMAANSTTPVKTFSIGFSEADFDELRYARLVAERFSTDHHEFVVEASALDVLPMLVRHVGDPFADSSIVPSYYVAKTARAHVTVALNGDGGDELFAGYDRYQAAQLAFAVERAPSPARWALATLARLVPAAAGTPRLLRRIRRFGAVVQLPRDARYLAWVGHFALDDQIYGDRLRARDDPALAFAEAIAETSPRSDIERLQAIDMRTYLPGDLLVKMDIASMAASLEARSPFLDHRLMELVDRLPARFKLRRGRSKHLLRRLMTGTLPDEILTRRKMGFGVPVGTWMRGPLRPLLEHSLLGTPDRQFVDRREVARLMREHLSREADHTYRLWTLLMLELWFTHVVEDRSSPPVPDPLSTAATGSAGS